MRHRNSSQNASPLPGSAQPFPSSLRDVVRLRPLASRGPDSAEERRHCVQVGVGLLRMPLHVLDDRRRRQVLRDISSKQRRWRIGAGRWAVGVWGCTILLCRLVVSDAGSRRRMWRGTRRVGSEHLLLLLLLLLGEVMRRVALLGRQVRLLLLLRRRGRLRMLDKSTLWMRLRIVGLSVLGLRRHASLEARMRRRRLLSRHEHLLPGDVLRGSVARGVPGGDRLRCSEDLLLLLLRVIDLLSLGKVGVLLWLRVVESLVLWIVDVLLRVRCWMRLPSVAGCGVALAERLVYLRSNPPSHFLAHRREPSTGTARGVRPAYSQTGPASANIRMRWPHLLKGDENRANLLSFAAPRP